MLIGSKIESMIRFNPRKLFLIDGLGAILSAFMLGIVLVTFESVFGIPSSTLYFLAIIPIIFAIFDFYCFQKQKIKLSRFLKVIAIVNLLYCCLSIGFAFYHIDIITIFGWAYILIEVIIIISLSILEFKVAQKVIRSN